MRAPRPPHVVRKASIEHALLASASARPMTRWQLTLKAVERGLKRYDDLTIRTALRRLTAAGFLEGQRGRGGFRVYRLMPEGQQLLNTLS